MSVLTKYSLSELLEPVIIKNRTLYTTLLLKPVIGATLDCALKVWCMMLGRLDISVGAANISAFRSLLPRFRRIELEMVNINLFDLT